MLHKMKNFKFIILALALGCNTSESTEKEVENVHNVEKNLNISLLLDLSDRIDTTIHSNKTMEFYKRDIGYIKSVADVFSKHVRTKRAFFINDNIRVFIDPEPQSTEVNRRLESMKSEFTSKSPNIASRIKNLSNIYEQQTTALYTQTLEDNDYVGSDIWNFFKRKAKDFCVVEDHTNILVILTDGYMYHEDSKYLESNRSSYLTSSTISSLGLNSSGFKKDIEEKDMGFIATRSDLADLQILVIGINPNKKSGNPYEGDIIQEYWSKWFQEMGVQRYKIVGAELPTNTENLITDFILNGD
ncbi:MAG: hypothetical protein ACI9K1_000357 [Arcticibacterium sp.]